MAIYINDRILQPKTGKDATIIEREYAEGVEKVNQLFEKFRKKNGEAAYIQISRNVKDSDKVVSINGKKTKKFPPVALPVEIPYYTEDMGSFTIRYSTSNPRSVPTGDGSSRIVWNTKYIEFNESMNLTEREKDLAWFLLFASSLVRKGVYQLVDVQAKYEGTFEEIVTKKDATDAIISGDEELARHIARKFINESYIKLDYKELAVKIIQWCDQTNNWQKVGEEVKAYNSEKVLDKAKVSVIEFDGEEVVIQKCPPSVSRQQLMLEAKELGIKVTVPPQSNDVLFSLVAHVKAKAVAVNG